MSKKVLKNIATKYKNIQKYEGKTILNEGIAIGEARSEERGRRKEKFDTARRLRNAAMSDMQVHQFTNLSLDDLRLLSVNDENAGEYFVLRFNAAH